MSSQIFVTLPPEVDTLCSVSDMVAVRDIFLAHPGVWMTADSIERAAGWRAQRTGEKVRKVVNELVEVGFPVVHGHYGFMLTSEGSCVRAAMSDLENRMRGIARKREAYARIAERLDGGQLSLCWWGVS
jgi:hypothetical protein